MISDQPVGLATTMGSMQSENLPRSEDASGFAASTTPEFMTMLQQGLLTFLINILIA